MARNIHLGETVWMKRWHGRQAKVLNVFSGDRRTGHGPTVLVRDSEGRQHEVAPSDLTRRPVKSNPPSGFIPCKAVKITRNKGKVEVRIRK